MPGRQALKAIAGSTHAVRRVVRASAYAAMAVAAGSALASHAQTIRHNLASLALIRHPTVAGWFDATVDRTTAQLSVRRRAAPASYFPDARKDDAWAPWESLADGADSEHIAREWIRAIDARGGSARSFGALMHATATIMPPDSFLPRGVAEYEYGLALRASERHDSARALRHFARAVVCRPGAWPDGFVAQYRSAIRGDEPEVAAALAKDEEVPVASLRRIAMGRKDAYRWEMPLEIGAGWMLDALAIRSMTALELGLPITVETFWRGPSGVGKHLTFRGWNLMPNGGFELRAPRAVGELGWALPESAPPTAMTAERFVDERGRASQVLSVLPVEGRSNGAIARPVSVTPGTLLLWHAWVDVSPGGNPMIFATWFDANRIRIDTEMPLQGHPKEERQANYAGVLRVPRHARFVSFALMNWEGTGAIRWDDLLMVQTQPPS